MPECSTSGHVTRHNKVTENITDVCSHRIECHFLGITTSFAQTLHSFTVVTRLFPAKTLQQTQSPLYGGRRSQARMRSPPPEPGGGLGEVSRAPVLMSFVLISGSCCRRQFWSPTACDDERRAPAVKSGVSLLSMPPVKRFCSALPFHLVQTFTT